MSEEAVAIAVLQENYKNITEAITEIKCDVKDTKKSVDDLAIKFQEFGGLYNQQVGINNRVTNLENWQNKIIGALILTEIILLPLAFYSLFKILDK